MIKVLNRGKYYENYKIAVKQILNPVEIMSKSYCICRARFLNTLENLSNEIFGLNSNKLI